VLLLLLRVAVGGPNIAEFFEHRLDQPLGSASSALVWYSTTTALGIAVTSWSI
jgi:hypothetical protein